MLIRKQIAILLSTLCLFTLLGSWTWNSQAEAAGTWNQIWSDEFNGSNGTGVDGSKWNSETGAGGWGNNELQYYTNRTNNAYMDNGNLIIQALKENYNGAPYTSARLTTAGKFDVKYGKIEMRAKLPYGKGIWPAFWMLGSDIGSNQWPNMALFTAPVTLVRVVYLRLIRSVKISVTLIIHSRSNGNRMSSVGMWIIICIIHVLQLISVGINGYLINPFSYYLT
jgi:hypothetical protein